MNWKKNIIRSIIAGLAVPVIEYFIPGSWGICVAMILGVFIGSF